MRTTTSRRWVDEPVMAVWQTLVDLGGIAASDDRLRLLECSSDDGLLHAGTTAKLAVQHGLRSTSMRLQVVTQRCPDHLVLSVTEGPSRWVVTIELHPMSRSGTDVLVAAQRDPAGGGRRRLVRGRTEAHDVADLVDVFARQAVNAHGWGRPAPLPDVAADLADARSPLDGPVRGSQPAGTPPRPDDAQRAAERS